MTLEVHQEAGTRETYSQFGEDLILDSILKRSALASKNNGVYVDIGACWPVKFSNTYMFYRRGWSGICIDPRPGFDIEFSVVRPRDVCVNCGLSDSRGKLTYFMFENPVFNSFDSARAMALDNQGRKGAAGRRIIERTEVCIETLQSVLDKNFSASQQIDFVSLDVEGLELPILKSIDFDRNKPIVWVVEQKSKTVEESLNSEICRFMKAQGYSVGAITNQNIFFELR